MKPISIMIIISLLFFACSNEDGKGDSVSSLDSSGKKSNVHNHDATTSPSVETPLDQVVIAANKVVLSDQIALVARLTDTTIRITAYGYVSWDERRNRKIAARTGGRVERLHVKYNYQYIHNGQKIIDIYSPELNAYTAEYLHHFTTPGDEVLLDKSRQKLRLLGVTGSQLKELEIKGSISSTIPVFSKSSGYVLFNENSSSAGSGMQANSGVSGSTVDKGEMSNNTQITFAGAAPGLRLREGMYVNRNQTLFWVNDFSIAWGLLSFHESTQPLLKQGITVIVKSELLDQPFRLPIAFIEPAFTSGAQKFVRVRVHLPNGDHRLKINSLLSAELDITLTRQLVIPSAAVFSLGQRKIVWIKTGTTPNGKNIFTARDVQLRLSNKDVAIVMAGLKEGELVAADAGYLLDSQSLIEQ